MCKANALGGQMAEIFDESGSRNGIMQIRRNFREGEEDEFSFAHERMRYNKIGVGDDPPSI